MSAAKRPARRDESAAPPASAKRPAIRSLAAVSFFLAIFTAGLAADLLSKHFVFESLLNDPSVEVRLDEFRRRFRSDKPLESDMALQFLRISRRVCPGVSFTLTTNSGIAFALPMPSWAVVAATLFAVGMVIYFFATSEARMWPTHLAMACILAGALGNLYDRLFATVCFPGMQPIRYQVRDFIDCSRMYYPPIFNVADVLLVVGVAVLSLHWIIDARKHAREDSNL